MNNSKIPKKLINLDSPPLFISNFISSLKPVNNKYFPGYINSKKSENKENIHCVGPVPSLNIFPNIVVNVSERKEISKLIIYRIVVLTF